MASQKNGKLLPNGTVKMSPASGQNILPATMGTTDAKTALKQQANGNAKVTPAAKTKLPSCYGKKGC